MRCVAIVLLPLLAGCPTDDNAPPPKLEGHWELLQIKTSEGEVDGSALVLSKFPGCSWARRTFTFA